MPTSPSPRLPWKPLSCGRQFLVETPPWESLQLPKALGVSNGEPSAWLVEMGEVAARDGKAQKRSAVFRAQVCHPGTLCRRRGHQRALAVPGAVPTGSLWGPREGRVSIVPISRVGD